MTTKCTGGGDGGVGVGGGGGGGGRGGGRGRGGIISIHVMILQPLHISFVLIFSGLQHTTLIITVSSFSLKVWSRISLVHKIQHQNQNKQLTSSSLQHCP